MSSLPPTLRIGIDVGGTNTDGVLLDPSVSDDPTRAILSWHKSPTTPDPTIGIHAVLSALLTQANVDPARIASVTIGTTHFINAVVEQDRARLAPVAVFRLCGPFSRDVPPAIDWPESPTERLRSIICAHSAFLDGGLEVDGEPIMDVCEEQVAEQCALIKAKGIRSVVVNGVFAPVDIRGKESQEERVGAWIAKYYPEADVVLSKHVATLGFLERENAALLNASIRPYARTTIAAFQRAVAQRLHPGCPVFLTQNDGTILSAARAAHLPIRTFSSGPTNSMCGAAFLVRGMRAGAEDESGKGPMLVVDIGGTTTDVGMLLPSGLPRQAAAITTIAGIRVNFSCPDVQSIGLGGGSIVRTTPTGTMTIGPDSVGHRIHERALVFGGDIHTATDYAVVIAAALSASTSASSTSLAPSSDLAIGTPALATAVLPVPALPQYTRAVRRMLEGVIDRMKTSAADVPVLLVGGGAVLAPDTLKGASRVLRSPLGGVANAVGAAIARVSGTVDTVVNTVDRTPQQIVDDVTSMAVAQAVANGAVRGTVEIAEMEMIPLAYVANRARVVAKVIGDFDFSRPDAGASLLDSPDSEADAALQHSERANDIIDKDPLQPSTGADVNADAPGPSTSTTPTAALDIVSYTPTVTSAREWIVSETDLEWIADGCYILGTGGGGTPYPDLVHLRQLMRRDGAVIRVVAPQDLKDDAVVACGGGKGSPTVGMEKLPANEMMEAQNLVYAQLGYKPDAVIALEIGGGNGLQGMLLGASTNMNIPTVDGDWMGRAYPVSWQITPVALSGEKAHFLPTAISDGKGNHMLMTSATSERMIERAFRAALSEMGSYVGCAKGPCSGRATKEWVVENTISLAWRIGRAVALCRARGEIDNVADAIIDQVGGHDAAKLLFRGKIVAVERKLIKGHVYGEVVIAAVADDAVPGAQARRVFTGKMKIPFKNENIVARVVDVDLATGAERETVVASVPDLICVCDAGTGAAIGTPEYRYGLLVTVLGIQASDKWTSTARGIEIGGPAAFGMDDVEYRPLGVFRTPRSVIDEYQPR